MSFDVSTQHTHLNRVLWNGLVLLGITIAVSIIGNTLNQWEKTPVIVTINDEYQPISEVAFPTVIICPDGELQWTEFISQVCHLE
jgi:hypothetical protein